MKKYRVSYWRVCHEAGEWFQVSEVLEPNPVTGSLELHLPADADKDTVTIVEEKTDE